MTAFLYIIDQCDIFSDWEYCYIIILKRASADIMYLCENCDYTLNYKYITYIYFRKRTDFFQFCDFSLNPKTIFERKHTGIILFCDFSNIIFEGKHAGFVCAYGYSASIHEEEHANVIQLCDYSTTIFERKHTGVIKFCDYTTVVFERKHTVGFHFCDYSTVLLKYLHAGIMNLGDQCDYTLIYKYILYINFQKPIGVFYFCDINSNINLHTMNMFSHEPSSIFYTWKKCEYTTKYAYIKFIFVINHTGYSDKYDLFEFKRGYGVPILIWLLGYCYRSYLDICVVLVIIKFFSIIFFYK